MSEPFLVRDLMTVGVPTCPPDTLIRDLAQRMLEKGWEAVVVLDRTDGHAMGIVSQDELIRAYSLAISPEKTAEEIMRPEVPQIPPDIPLTAAAQLMQDLKTRVLILTHHAGGIIYPAGIITYQHLLRHLAAQSPEELQDLGIHAQRQTPVQMFIERREATRRRNLGLPDAE